MDDEIERQIERIPGTLHRATQTACCHWTPVVPVALEVKDDHHETLIPEPTEGPPATPDMSAV
jgi:hypothetical protein